MILSASLVLAPVPAACPVSARQLGQNPNFISDSPSVVKCLVFLPSSRPPPPSRRRSRRPPRPPGSPGPPRPPARPGARRAQASHDHVLLQAPQVVDLAADRLLGQDPGRLLEGGGRDEAVRRERRLGDAEEPRLGGRGGPGHPPRL